MSKALIAALGLALGAAACREPSAPSPRGPISPEPAFTISDGAHGASPRLYFLPPLVPPPSYSGTFDPSAFGAGSSDTVFVCQWTANSCLVRVAGFGAVDVQVDLTTETYYVNWNTRTANLDPANQYRLLVRVSGHVVGFADLAVVLTGADKKNVDQTLFIPVVAGTILPIHFRLETVPNQPPTAHFTVNCAYLTCTFDSSGSTDDVGITSRTWSFGDGTGGTSDVAPTHAYASAGTYTVTLTVEDGGGLSDVSSQQVTVSAPPSAIIGLAAFQLRTCIIGASGQLFCWGADWHSPANAVTTPASFGPYDPTYVAIGGANGSAGHGCAIHGNSGVIGGQASCWGNDTYGQLGNGSGDGSTVIFVSSPVLVNGTAFTSITTGGLHTCALTTDGAAYCWGYNGFGELGDGTTTLRNIPTAVLGGLTFKAIAAGAFHTCGITTQGAAYCWGATSSGDLGTNQWSGASQTTPIPVVGPNLGAPLAFSSIAAGFYVTCGVTTDAKGYCWGMGSWGQLGNGTETDSPYPSAVTGNNLLSQISIGGHHTCAVTTGGSGLCWGYNDSGQLGNGTSGIVIIPTPGPVSFAGVTLTQISAGYDHTCAIAAGGSLYCWGNNGFGQIGDGTTTNRSLPTLVTFP